MPGAARRIEKRNFRERATVRRQRRQRRFTAPAQAGNDSLRRPSLLLRLDGRFDLLTHATAIAGSARWGRAGKSGFPTFHDLGQSEER